MSFEAYSVAIRLKLIDGVSIGLIGMAGKFAAFNKHIGQSKEELAKLELQLKNLKMMGFVGGEMMGAGGAALGLLSGPINAAREYELAYTKLKSLNLGDVVNKQADAFARGTNVMGVSAKELMVTLSESVGIFGSYAEAQKHAPQLAALNAANSAIYGGKIDALDEGSTRALLKFIDRRGGNKDDATYQRALNLAEKMVTGSGGFIQFRDLGQFSSMGSTAFRGLSDKGVENMSLLLQEQGGARAGTAMMSIYQNLIAGRTPVKTMNLLAQYGLGATHQIADGTVGGKGSTLLAMDHIKDAGLLQSDPATWFKSVFLPALAAHGVTSEGGILKATNDLLSNRNASGQASIFTTQLLQVARDSKLTDNAKDAAGVIKQFQRDPNARWQDMSKKYQNMLVELGEAALPLVTKAIGGLLVVVKGITWFAHNFPVITKILITAFAGFAALMVAGGSVLMIAAGIKGLQLALTVGKPIGTMLLDVASGLGGLAGKLGGSGGLLAKLGWVGAAGTAGYAAGSWLNDKFHLSDKIVNALSDDSYNPNGSRFVAGKNGKNTTIHTQINIDGRKVADAVSHHQANDFKPTGGEAFDPTMTLPSVGLATGFR